MPPDQTNIAPLPYYTSLGAFEAWFRHGLPVLTYHVIGPCPSGVQMKGLYVSPRLFDRQLSELRRAGFHGPSYGTVLQPAAEGRRQILITMDDGVGKTGAHALPILSRHGFKAIQFIVAGLIGKTNEWQVRASGEAEERLMDPVEIRDWLAAGHQIGAHTLTHPWLTRLTPAEAKEEIEGSKKLLEDRFGQAIEHFCYPYGDHNPQVIDLVCEAGYRSACTTEPGLNTPATPSFQLRRVMARYRSRSWRTLIGTLKRLVGLGGTHARAT